MSILFSDEYPVVVLAFRVRNRGSTWLDGTPTGRIYVEKRDMEQQARELIEEGRLTLDPEGRRKPVLVSVRGSGGFYAAILEDPEAAEEEAELGPLEKTRPSQPSMQPVTSYDEERNVIRLMEENRFHDFVEVLEAYKPMIDEEDLTGFDGRSIHPVTTKTLVTEMKAYSKRHGSRGDSGTRTVVLLDRSVSMAEPWSLWEQYPKIMVARFLANAVAASHSNVAVYSFGETLRIEHSPDDAEPLDDETRLDAALRQVSLFEPERLVILTDGKPVYIDGVDTEEDCEEAVRLLDTFGRSGIQSMIFTLGQDREMETYYGRLIHTPGTLVSPLGTGGDVVRMLRRLAEWF
jgi:hypothetical protein